MPPVSVVHLHLFDSVLEVTQGETLNAYLAGIIDGEGSLGQQGTSGFALDVGMAEERFLNNICAHVGGAVYKAPPPKKPTHRQIWHWRLTGQKLRVFLEEILPYLVLKQGEAKIIIAYYNTEFSHRDPRKAEIRQMFFDFKEAQRLGRFGDKDERLH